MDLGLVLEGLGRGFGRLWASQDSEKRASKLNLHKIAIFQGFRKGLGRSWEGLGRVLGGFGEGFGRVLGGFREGLGRILQGFLGFRRSF